MCAGIAVALLLAGWFASEVFEGETLAFDMAVRDGIHAYASPFLTTVMIGLSIIGSPLVVVIIGLAAVAIFFARGDKKEAALVLSVGAGELILNSLLKLIYFRDRPGAFFNYPLPASFSFPSGHSFGSFCVYGVLGWLISTRVNTPVLRWLIRAAFVALIFSIGLSRVYLGVHYPTDVLAGYLIGAIWIIVAVLIVSAAADRKRKKAAS